MLAASACATSSAVRVALPPGQAPFEGCARRSLSPGEHVFECAGWTAALAQVEGATPKELKAERATELRARAGGALAEEAGTVTDGAETFEVTRFTARGEGDAASVALFGARPQAGKPTRTVTCTAARGEPMAVARCELATARLLAAGLPPLEKLPENVTRFFGDAVQLDGDCQCDGGRTPVGGRVRCGDRLVVRWDAVPGDATPALLDGFATSLQQELGGHVDRDAPACTVRGGEASCVRLRTRSGYTLLVALTAGAGGMLVNCGFRDSEAGPRALCEGLVQVAAVAPVAP